MPPQWNDLPPEWRTLISALSVGSEQLLVRLSALEQNGLIAADTASAYAGWTARVASTLAALADAIAAPQPAATQE